MKRKSTTTGTRAQKSSARSSVETVKFDQPKEVRAIARERVGAVKPARPIPPKDARKKPKHKKSMELE